MLHGSLDLEFVRNAGHVQHILFKMFKLCSLLRNFTLKAPKEIDTVPGEVGTIGIGSSPQDIYQVDQKPYLNS